MPSMKTDKLIHEILAEWIEDAHLSQAAVARATGRTTGGISFVFTGKRKPSAHLIVQIAELCKKPPEEALRLMKVLKPITPIKQKVQELSYLAEKMPEKALDDVIDFAAHRLAIAEKRGEYVVTKTKGA